MGRTALQAQAMVECVGYWGMKGVSSVTASSSNGVMYLQLEDLYISIVCVICQA